MNLGSVVSMDWQSTAEGETILQHFYNPQTSGRKLFGVLERPAVPPSVEEVSYKLFVTGPTGVGKTATISRLAGTKTSSTYNETMGIQKTNVYWPVKIWEKIIMFKLQFWEAGETSTKKYSHILAACESKADGIVFVFSFTDKNSFSDVSHAMGKMLYSGDNPTPIVIGTRFALKLQRPRSRGEFLAFLIPLTVAVDHLKRFFWYNTHQMSVSMSEIKEFEMKNQVPVLKIENRWSGDKNEVHEVAPLLNIICERLWSRDQDYLYKQSMNR